MLRALRRRALCLAPLALVAACASSGGAPPAASPSGADQTAAQPEAASRGVQLAVKNDNSSEVTIYVITADETFRVGSVSSYNARSFVLPSRLWSPGERPRFVVQQLAGSESYVSPELLFGPGDTVVIEVGSWIRQSSTRVVGPR